MRLNYAANPRPVIERSKAAKAKLKAEDPDEYRRLNREKMRRQRARNKERMNELAAKYRRQRSERDPFGARRAWRTTLFKRKYGITADEYDVMMIAQSGRCAICLRAEERDECFHVDHCHRTGVVRGLLCNNCNLALGQMEDCPARLRAAAVYLEGLTSPRDAAAV